jgi:hypothetical protein
MMIGKDKVRIVENAASISMYPNLSTAHNPSLITSYLPLKQVILYRGNGRVVSLVAFSSTSVVFSGFI